ncbi:MAG: GtrA family protein [Cytophagales bacterium]|nr:MAG: GtrA family protein [Cytophagales bacterium]
MLFLLETKFNLLLKRKFVRFFLVSAIATTLNFAVFYALHKFFFIDYRLASGIGFFSGVLLGYFLNSRWTFKSSDDANPRKRFLKYYCVYLFSLGVNILMIDILVEYVGIYPSLANIITIGFTFVSNYLGTRFWVFKKPLVLP